ncbi:MAG: cupin domain-containing protein [Acidobacteriota bacterium]|nr:cupin domain-containing protein [Acidobacteriota bacterium]
MPEFLIQEPLTGLIHQSLSPHAASLSAWLQGSLTPADDGTHYGYVHQGALTLEHTSGRFTLSPGMYFAAPGACLLNGAGSGFVVTRHDYRGFFHIGGPVEEEGRLRYIDGCTDSLLIAPVKLGDPCLNLLHFPPGIHQTAHTHPSLRAGMVARGCGYCHLDGRSVELAPGRLFLIPSETLHCFSTRSDAMTVIAWHPDSDFGPADDDHPMINRTVVDGVSARYLDHIRTGGAS